MRDDPHRFVNYYESQVGGALPGFYGAPVMYGRGLGSLFSKLFRFVAPLVKRGFSIAKPHLKAAAGSIATDVFSRAMGSSNDQNQEGSGGIMVLSRRKRRRPPGMRTGSTKRARSNKTRSVLSGRVLKRKPDRSSDIFE